MFGLTPDAYREVKKVYEETHSIAATSRVVGVAPSTVSRIVKQPLNRKRFFFAEEPAIFETSMAKKSWKEILTLSEEEKRGIKAIQEDLII